MLNDNQKIDIAYKSILGRGVTAIGKQHFLEPYTTKQVKPESVLMYLASIPASISSPVLNRYYDKTGVNLGITFTSSALLYYTKITATLIPGTVSSFKINSIGSMLDYSVKSGAYAPIVNVPSGAVIPFGTNDMYVDAESDIVTFFGGLPSGITTSIEVTCWRYVGKTLATVAFAETSNMPETKTIQLTAQTIPANLAWDGSKFVYTHNIGSLSYNVELYDSTDIIQSSVKKTINTVEIMSDDAFTDADGVYCKLYIIK